MHDPTPAPASPPPATNADSPPARGVLGGVFLTIFPGLVGFGIIPIRPFYAEDFGASPTTVTLPGASYSLMQLLFAAFWGRVSDRVGRRPVVLLSISVSVVGDALFGVAHSLAVLFAARVLGGLGNANIGSRPATA